MQALNRNFVLLYFEQEHRQTHISSLKHNRRPSPLFGSVWKGNTFLTADILPNVLIDWLVHVMDGRLVDTSTPEVVCFVK